MSDVLFSLQCINSIVVVGLPVFHGLPMFPKHKKLRSLVCSKSAQFLVVLDILRKFIF